LGIPNTYRDAPRKSLKPRRRDEFMTDQVGIIGLGIMGSAYARNLSKGGFEIVGCEIDDAKFNALEGVRLSRAATPADVAARVDRIITSLPNAKAFATVMGELGQASRQVVVADTCTLTVSEKEVGRSLLEKAGGILLDCPVGGTGAQAAKGDLVIFGSGDEPAFARIRPVFEKMARVVHYLGPFGAGSTMKFIHNLLVAIHNCSAGEAFTLGMKAGIDPQVVYDVISSSAGTSRMFEVRGPMMVSGDYDTNISSTLETILKDIACISQHARDLACPTPLFSLAGEIHRAAAAQGFAMSDPAVVCKTIGSLAGIDRG
jgi:putative dehydrogenase